MSPNNATTFRHIIQGFLIFVSMVLVAIVAVAILAPSFSKTTDSIGENSMPIIQPSQNPKDIKLEMPLVPTKTHPINVTVDGKDLGAVHAVAVRAGTDGLATNVVVELPIATTLEFCGYLLPTVTIPEDEEMERLLAHVYDETAATSPIDELGADQHVKAEFVRELVQNFCAKF